MFGCRLKTWNASLCLALCWVACACRTTNTETKPESSTVTTSHAATPSHAIPTQPAPARVTLSPSGQEPITVEVEVVDTPAARQQGLMYRKQLAPNAGMLFIFERSEPHAFWMHNTLVPLDMIFITADWRILGIVENATPLTDDPRLVPGDSQYVLEVNAGFSRTHGLQAGTSVRYQPASAVAASAATTATAATHAN